MAGKIKFSFQMRMLLMVLGTCCILACTFMAFQYRREKEYKADMMDNSLQMHNGRILDDLRKGESIESIVARITAPTENLRITLIDADGNVTYDSRYPVPVSNHNNRPEVKAARRTGEGHALERLSESD